MIDIGIDFSSHFFETTAAVLGCFKTFNLDRGNLDSFLESFLQSRSATCVQGQHQESMKVLLLAIIGASTALFTPAELWDTDPIASSSAHAPPFNDRMKRFSTGVAKRPVSALLRSLCLWPGGVPPATAEHDATAAMQWPKSLLPRSLHYYTVFTIGGLSINWTSILKDHCAFDESNRTISMFK